MNHKGHKGLKGNELSSRFTVPHLLLLPAVICTSALAAQGPPGLKTGNPTPGVSQPVPPDLAERITN